MRRGRVCAVAATVMMLVGAACSTNQSDEQAAPVITDPDQTAGVNPDLTGGLRWGPCPQRTQLECATLPVPVDREMRDGPRTEVRLVRSRAVNNPNGTVLVNPGGPGVDAMSVTSQTASMLGGHWDVVGFTPRAADSMSVCGTRWRDIDPLPSPETRSLVEQPAADTATECFEDLGATQSHVSTQDAVEDLEAVRVALGEPQINYLGFSYGTLLGFRYLQRYEDHVRAMVLDGVIDPDMSLAEMLSQQAAAFVGPVDEMLRVCGCDFANLHRRLGQEPVGGLTAAKLVWATLAAGYDPQSTSTYTAAFRAAETGNPIPMLNLAERYTTAADFGVYLGMSCTDRDVPATVDEWHRLAAQQPGVIGPAFVYEMLPCVSWPTRPDITSQPADPVTGRNAVLVIGNTGDPATPLINAEHVHTLIPWSTLLRVRQDGHTAAFTNRCVTRTVNQFLVDQRTDITSC